MLFTSLSILFLVNISVHVFPDSLAKIVDLDQFAVQTIQIRVRTAALAGKYHTKQMYKNQHSYIRSHGNKYLIIIIL